MNLKNETLHVLHMNGNGSEWWEYKELPKEPVRTAKVRGVIADRCHDWWGPLPEWEENND